MPTSVADLERKVSQNTNDIREIYGMLDDIQHTQRDHGKILDQHGKILEQHTQKLDQHGQKLERIESMLEKVLGLLNKR